MCSSRLVACLSTVSITPSNRHSDIIPQVSFFDLFSCRTSRIHRITLQHSQSAPSHELLVMIMLGKHSLLRNTPCFRCNPSHSARLSLVRLLWYLVPLLCNQAFRHGDYLLRQLPAPLPCLPCICCLIQPGHPQPSCHSGPSELWVSLPGPTGVPSDAQAGWHKGQNANPYLLHCCAAALLLHC